MNFAEIENAGRLAEIGLDLPQRRHVLYFRSAVNPTVGDPLIYRVNCPFGGQIKMRTYQTLSSANIGVSLQDMEYSIIRGYNTAFDTLLFDGKLRKVIRAVAIPTCGESTPPVEIVPLNQWPAGASSPELRFLNSTHTSVWRLILSNVNR